MNTDSQTSHHPSTSYNSRYTLRSSLPAVVAVLGLRHIFSKAASKLAYSPLKKRRIAVNVKCNERFDIIVSRHPWLDENEKQLS
jgi:hypothetical protein